VIPKFNYFRSKKHLMNVADLPCQNCYIEGQTQAAHSNWAEHGKGRGIKASDEYTAALCQTCHTELDQGSHLSKDQRRQMWNRAYERTKERLKEQNLWIS
jgi:ferredoxin